MTDAYRKAPYMVPHETVGSLRNKLAALPDDMAIAVAVEIHDGGVAARISGAACDIEVEPHAALAKPFLWMNVRPCQP